MDQRIPIHPHALIAWRDLRHLVPLSRTTIWRLVRAGKFPEPVAISATRQAWRMEDIQAWIAARDTRRAGGALPFRRAAPRTPNGPPPRDAGHEAEAA